MSPSKLARFLSERTLLVPYSHLIWYGRGDRNLTMTIQAQFPDEQGDQGAFARQPDAFTRLGDLEW